MATENRHELNMESNVELEFTEDHEYSKFTERNRSDCLDVSNACVVTVAATSEFKPATGLNPKTARISKTRARHLRFEGPAEEVRCRETPLDARGWRRKRPKFPLWAFASRITSKTFFPAAPDPKRCPKPWLLTLLRRLRRCLSIWMPTRPCNRRCLQGLHSSRLLGQLGIVGQVREVIASFSGSECLAVCDRHDALDILCSRFWSQGCYAW